MEENRRFNHGQMISRKKQKQPNLLPKDLLVDLMMAEDVRQKVVEQVNKTRKSGWSPRGVQFSDDFPSSQSRSVSVSPSIEAF